MIDDFIENGAAVQRLSKDLANSAKVMSSTEARFLVDYYYISQNDRIRFDGQTRSMNEGEEPTGVLAWLSEQSSTMEKQVKRALDKYTDAHPIGQWIKSQHGFGPVLAAGFLVHIDITKAPTAGHIWSYAGLAPGKEWVSAERAAQWVKQNGLDVGKAAHDWNRNPEVLHRMATSDKDGNEIKMTAKSLAAAISRRPWNAELKKLCYKVGDCLIKFHNNEKCYYGHLYKERLMYEWDINLTGGYGELARSSDYDKSTEAWAWVNGCYKATDIRKFVENNESLAAVNVKKFKGEPGSGDRMLPPAHLLARARRFAVKIFLSHLHEVWYEHEFKRRVPNPFAIQHMGHAHRIQIPGYNSPYAGDVPSTPFRIDHTRRR